MASGADKLKMPILLSSVSGKISQFSRELHFVTKLLPQVWRLPASAHPHLHQIK